MCVCSGGCSGFIMAFTAPEQLNQISDDVLRAHVDATLLSLGPDVGYAVVPKVANFITADVLLRLHNMVAEKRRMGHSCEGWSKQAVLARVVATFTGVKVSKGDAEYVGNAQDYFLKDYVKQLAKAHKSALKAASRARKAGRELPSEQGGRSSELKLQIYKCKFGGVPRDVILSDSIGSELRHPSQPNEPVPWRTVRHADEENVFLQRRIVELKEQAAVGEREKRHNLIMLCQAVEGKRNEERRVELASQKAAQAQAEAQAAKERADVALQELTNARTATQESAHQAHKWKQKATDTQKKYAQSERAIEAKRNELLCLEGKLVSALCEAGHEQRKRKLVEDAAEQQMSQLRNDLNMAMFEVDASKKLVKDAQRACVVKEGEVLRLEGKLVRAFAEVQGEQQKRKRTEELATRETVALQSALSVARDEAEACKKEVRSAERMCSMKQGEVLRLEGKLGRALTEVALAKQAECSARSQAVELRTKLSEQEQANKCEVDRLRVLKNRMAQEKRDAQRLASSASQMQSKLNATRERLRELRMEVSECHSCEVELKPGSGDAR